MEAGAWKLVTDFQLVDKVAVRCDVGAGVATKEDYKGFIGKNRVSVWGVMGDLTWKIARCETRVIV